MIEQARMMSPPIVGVSPLDWCVSGVPARITCRTRIARSRRTIAGPMRNDRRSAVTAAAAARTDM
jgi:hypothetical protein